MRWLLLWAVLVIAAAAFLGFIGLRLWRQFKALTAEVEAASHRMSDVSPGRSTLPSR